MPLTLTVSLIVLGVIVLIGVAGYLIDEGEERVERSTGNHEHRASR